MDFARSKLCSLIKTCGWQGRVATSWNGAKPNTFDSKWRRRGGGREARSGKDQAISHEEARVRATKERGTPKRDVLLHTGKRHQGREEKSERGRKRRGGERLIRPQQPVCSRGQLPAVRQAARIPRAAGDHRQSAPAWSRPHPCEMRIGIPQTDMGPCLQRVLLCLLGSLWQTAQAFCVFVSWSWKSSLANWPLGVFYSEFLF